MNYKVYTMYDKVSGVSSQLLLAKNIKELSRVLLNSVNFNKNSALLSMPEDYEIHLVGTYDNEKTELYREEAKFKYQIEEVIDKKFFNDEEE